ncbi:hypothetical protein EMIT0P228_200025 [Pseudomonas brassicacearum]
MCCVPMRGNRFISVVVLAFSLLAIVWGVSTFLAMIVAVLISLLFQTDSNWVFIWLGFPLSWIFALYWVVTRWDYVKSFISGRGGVRDKGKRGRIYFIRR